MDPNSYEDLREEIEISLNNDNISNLFKLYDKIDSSFFLEENGNCIPYIQLLFKSNDILAPKFIDIWIKDLYANSHSHHELDVAVVTSAIHVDNLLIINKMYDKLDKIVFLESNYFGQDDQSNLSRLMDSNNTLAPMLVNTIIKNILCNNEKNVDILQDKNKMLKEILKSISDSQDAVRNFGRFMNNFVDKLEYK